MSDRLLRVLFWNCLARAHSQRLVLQVVVLTNIPLAEAVEIDRICHSKGVAVVHSGIRGVFAYVFCDFGPSFLVNDVDGQHHRPFTCLEVVSCLALLPPACPGIAPPSMQLFAFFQQGCQVLSAKALCLKSLLLPS